MQNLTFSWTEKNITTSFDITIEQFNNLGELESEDNQIGEDIENIVTNLYSSSSVTIYLKCKDIVLQTFTARELFYMIVDPFSDSPDDNYESDSGMEEGEFDLMKREEFRDVVKEKLKVAYKNLNSL